MRETDKVVMRELHLYLDLILPKYLMLAMHG